MRTCVPFGVCGDHGEEFISEEMLHLHLLMNIKSIACTHLYISVCMLGVQPRFVLYLVIDLHPTGTPHGHVYRRMDMAIMGTIVGTTVCCADRITAACTHTH